MKNQIANALKISFLILCFGVFSACGQKGPLKVEQPPVQTQTEEPEQTK